MSLITEVNKNLRPLDCFTDVTKNEELDEILLGKAWFTSWTCEEFLISPGK